MQSGWIRLHRKMLDCPKLCMSSYLSVWVYILLNVQFSPIEIWFAKEKITLAAGQGVFSLNDVCKDMNIPKTTMYRVVRWLEEERKITTQNSNKGTLITVCNWEKYQNREAINENDSPNENTRNERGTEVGNERETNGKRMGNEWETYLLYKERKNVIRVYIVRIYKILTI